MDKNVKVIKASKALQSKAGKGEIAPRAIAAAEEALIRNSEDFTPLAQKLLDALMAGIENARGLIGVAHHPETKKEIAAEMTKPVMQLKANARMFKYDLVTSLANIMLDFLETIDDVDDDAVEIVTAHHKTLSLIVARKMTGDGGVHGPVLQKELTLACRRYFDSRKQ